MTGFEPQIYGIRSDRSTNCATTTTPYLIPRQVRLSYIQVKLYRLQMPPWKGSIFGEKTFQLRERGISDADDIRSWSSSSLDLSSEVSKYSISPLLFFAPTERYSQPTMSNRYSFSPSPVANLIKPFTSVIYNSRVVNLSNLLVIMTRVVNISNLLVIMALWS